MFFNLTLANTHGYPDRLDKSILFKEIILLSGIIQFCDLRGGQAALEINKVFTDWSSLKFCFPKAIAPMLSFSSL